MEVRRTKERYTYEDYYSWGEDAPRCELIDGVVYDMSAPTLTHQRISGEIFFQLKGYLRGKTCEAFIAPSDVRLNYDDADDTVVQPDIYVVCDKSKLEDGKSCKGAPDFVIEILSPSNSRHDTCLKLNKYLQAEVKEYWIVDPENKLIIAHRLLDKQYVTTTYTVADREVPVMILEDFAIPISEVFSE